MGCSQSQSQKNVVEVTKVKYESREGAQGTPAAKTNKVQPEVIKLTD